MHFSHFQPTKITFGAGAIKNIGSIVSLRGKRCLVVSEPIFDAVKPAYDKIFASLEEAGVQAFHFDGVKPNPMTHIVEVGCKVARQQECDVVLAVGGGSSIDTAKIVAAASAAESIDWPEWFNNYSQPFGVENDLPSEVLPLIAVSTTSGTGSQATHAAVITDADSHEKRTLFHTGFFPAEALVDPELMLTLPPRMTAMTGFDAFAHAFESYTSARNSPFVDVMALHAMGLIIEHLPAVVQNGSDLSLREKLALADTFAGICLTNGGACAPHPLGEILGSKHAHLPHGLTLSVVFPAFLKHQWSKQVERYAAVADLFGAQGTAEEKAEALSGCISRLIDSIGLEKSLGAVGVTEADVLDIEKCFCFDLPLTSGGEMKQILRDSL